MSHTGLHLLVNSSGKTHGDRGDNQVDAANLLAGLLGRSSRDATKLGRGHELDSRSRDSFPR